MSEEIPTGLASVEAIHGIERREEPAAPEPKVYEGHNAVEQAANDLTERRGRTSEAPIEKIEYLDGEARAVSAEQAARHLSQFHEQQRAAAELDDLSNLQSEIDLARLVYGPDGRQKIDPAIVQEALAAGQQSPQAEALQPEAPEAPPADGIDDDVRAALSNPKVRAAIEAPLLQAHQAAQAYTDALTHNAMTTASYIMADIPEFAGLSIEQATAQLQILDKQQPQRAYEIRQKLAAPKAMMEEAMRLDHQKRAHQAQVQRQQWQQFPKANDDAFAKAVAKDGPEVMQAVQKEIVEFVKESGIDPQTIRQLYESDPAIRSAPFQKIIYDAMRFRAAQRGVQHAAAKPIPSVQKPGISRTRGEIAQANLASLRSDIKNAEGQDQIKAAVRYMQAKRAARGG
jgi:hypothetical protein